MLVYIFYKSKINLQQYKMSAIVIGGFHDSTKLWGVMDTKTHFKGAV